MKLIIHSKLQWCSCRSLEMDKSLYSTIFWACDYLSMLGLKLIHVSKRCPSLAWIHCRTYHQGGHVAFPTGRISQEVLSISISKMSFEIIYFTLLLYFPGISELTLFVYYLFETVLLSVAGKMKGDLRAAQWQVSDDSMMTSSNGSIFRVTGHLHGEFTGEFPSQRPVTQSFDIFFDLCLNKRLSKQSWG